MWMKKHLFIQKTKLPPPQKVSETSKTCSGMQMASSSNFYISFNRWDSVMEVIGSHGKGYLPSTDPNMVTWLHNLNKDSSKAR